MKRLMRQKRESDKNQPVTRLNGQALTQLSSLICISPYRLDLRGFKTKIVSN